MYKKFIIGILLLNINIANVEIRSQIVINELLASNTSTNTDNLSNNYTDWIELYNNSNKNADIGNWYLSDNYKNPTKWKIPFYFQIARKGYKLFWTDNKDTLNHTNFKLNREGETIYLFNKDTVFVDSTSFTKQFPDVSYGRESDTSSVYNYFDKPTPNKPNHAKGSKSLDFSPATSFSKQAGFYKAAIKLELNTPQNTGTVYYTIDGSIPTFSSQVYTHPISIKKTTVVRARTYIKGKLPSIVSTQTYFINETASIPVISLSSTPDNFWDKKNGIYVKGVNFNPQKIKSANYFNKWERPVNLEYFDANGSLGFNIQAGIKIHGNSSRTFSQKTISVYTREKYGTPIIQHKIFDNKPNIPMKTFLLRNSGNDWGITMFLDAMAHTLVSGNIDIDVQAYKPAIVFLNGQYWGIHNIREKINKHYFKSNYNIDTKNVDIIEADIVSKKMSACSGDMKEYNKLIDFIKTHDLAVKENYEKINNIIDINEYINYYLTQIYIANRDWPNSNMKCWREKSDKGKWRWLLFDTDLSFGAVKGYYETNMINQLLGKNFDKKSHTYWNNQLFSNLCKNKEFKDEFVQRMAVYLNTVFAKKQVLQVIDSLKRNIEPEVKRNCDKWKGIEYTVSPFYITSHNPEEWQRHIDYIKVYASNRPGFVRKNFMHQFGIKDTVLIKLKINDTKGGEIKIMGYKIKESKFSCYMFSGIPVHLEAIPVKGYSFVGWKTGELEKKRSIVPRNGSRTIYFNISLCVTIPFIVDTFTKYTPFGFPLKSIVIFCSKASIFLILLPNISTISTG